jgi:hypothetical protein
MAKKLLPVFIFLSLISLFAVSCGDSTPSLAEDAIDLEQAVEEGMTLNEVYALMTPGLKNMAVIYPALNISLLSDGRWEFTPKEGSGPGDKDGPYQVLMIYSQPVSEGCYMLFFKNESIMEDAWFEYETALDIEKLLWTTETTDEDTSVPPNDQESTSYPMLDIDSFPENTPEWALAGYLNAWKEADWETMTEYTQLTWLNNEADAIGFLDAVYGFKDLVGAEIINTTEVSDVCVDIEYIIYYTFAGGEVSKVKITARIICESGPYEPSTEGQWGVNPVSALREEELE